MIKTITTSEQVIKDDILSIICDVCKAEYPIKDFAETQEFLNVELRGGFGSVFGDGSLIECNVCQHCLKNLLGAYLRVS